MLYVSLLVVMRLVLVALVKVGLVPVLRQWRVCSSSSRKCNIPLDFVELAAHRARAAATVATQK